MTVPSDNPLWDAHLERLRRLDGERDSAFVQGTRFRRSISDRQAAEARRGEWAARPPGRLGRRLLADLEPYLEFFAIARAS
jgi:hypothetical protein